MQSNAFANAIAERWIRSAKDEVLDQMILFGTGPLDRSLAQYGLVRPDPLTRTHSVLYRARIRSSPGWLSFPRGLAPHGDTA